MVTSADMTGAQNLNNANVSDSARVLPFDQAKHRISIQHTSGKPGKQSKNKTNVVFPLS
jgi:hypothetical protein